MMHVVYDIPSVNEISAYAVGNNYDYDWILEKGEVLLVIECKDGLFIVIHEEEQ